MSTCDTIEAVNDETEIKIWAELECRLGRDPNDDEFQMALNKAEEEAFILQEACL